MGEPIAKCTALRRLRDALSSAIGCTLMCPDLKGSDIIDRLIAIAREVDEKIAEADLEITSHWLSDETTPH